MFEDVNLLTFGMMFLPFVAALLAPSLFRLFGASVVWFLALLPALAFAHFATFLPAISQGAVITAGFEWVPALGLRFSWLIDGLSLTFALLITGIGTLIVLYAGGYLKGHVQQARFLSFLFRHNQPICTSGQRRCHAPKPALSRRAAAASRRGIYKVGAIPIPFLAAKRHGSANPCFGLPAFGHYGKGWRLSIDAS
jgi:hypothetical protein